MRITFLPKSDGEAAACVRCWVIGFFFITLILQVWRIYSLNATYDQGLFLQEIWNGLHGRPFESTLAAELSAPVMVHGELPQLGYRHLGIHFTPLLAIWIPLVGLLGVWSLPLIQVGLLSLSGWILFLLGQEYLSPKIAGWITCSFFCTGLVIGPSLENFHDLCIVPLLVFSLLLGISRNQKLLYLLTALALPLVREDVGLLSFSIGLWMMIRRPQWRIWGLGLCIYSLVAVLLITNWVMPIFGSDLSDRMMEERFGQYLDGKQAGTLTVLKSMFSNPMFLINEIIYPPGQTFRFLLTLGLPLAFLPLISFDSWLLISIPLFVALTSQGGDALAVSLRFVLYLVPGIFAGSIFWMRNKNDLLQTKVFRRFWRMCLVIALLFAIAGNPHRSLSAIIPDSVNPWVYIPIQKQWRRGVAIHQWMNLIPPEASVAADTHLIPQLAQRRILLRFPRHYQYLDLQGNSLEVDFVVSQPRFNVDYLPAFRNEGRLAQKSINLMDDLLQNHNYGIFFSDQKTIILKRNYLSSADKLESFNQEINELKAILKESF